MMKRFKSDENSKGGMNMYYNNTTNAWDAINSVKKVPFRAENNGVLSDNILGPEVDENLIGIMDSLDKSSVWGTEAETELSQRNDFGGTETFNQEWGGPYRG